MASPNRNEAPSLGTLIYTQGQHFRFHAAMKLLGTMRTTGTHFEYFAFPKNVFIKVYPTFSMPGTDIQSIVAPNKDYAVPQMFVNFMGIETRQGPLPDPYIEQVVNGVAHGDNAFHDFLSIFNTRIIHLFHQIIEKFQIGISLAPPSTTPYGKTLKALIGIAGDALSNRLAVPDHSLLYFTSAFWTRPRSAGALKNLLQTFFNTRLKIKQFLGEWHPIGIQQRTCVGGRHARFQTLGNTAVLGARFWDQQTFFQIIIGPLAFDKFVKYLKIGSIYNQLISLTNFFVDTLQTFQIRLILKKEDVPQTTLNHNSRLGWTSWLKTKPFTQDPDDVILDSNPNFLPPITPIITLL